MYTEINQAEPLALKPWELQALKRAHLLHGQLQTAIKHASNSALPELRQIDFMGDQSPYMQALMKLYREDMKLAGLLDTSDLLLHAEGPGAADHSPRLSAVNWLCTGAEKHIKHLLAAMLPMAQKFSRLASRDLDLRLTGIAPGSLYAGFALAGTSIDPAPGLLKDDADVLDWLRKALHALPVVPQFVGIDKLDNSIMEALPDPALRDAALVAAYELTPTGSKGIHTVEISSPRADDSMARTPHALGLKERVVLREAIRGAPLMRKTKHGSFTGILRAIDLDTNRITIRNISADLPGLRGALLETDAARGLLDQWVKIEGDYECNVDGRPRMMRVMSIAAAAQPLLIAI